MTRLYSVPCEDKAVVEIRHIRTRLDQLAERVDADAPRRLGGKEKKRFIKLAGMIEGIGTLADAAMIEIDSLYYDE